MAFEKTVDLPTGVSGSYFRLEAFNWDRKRRELSAHFSLYKDANMAATGEPLAPIVAKFRMLGDEFDAKFAAGAVAQSAEDILAIIYKEAQAASEARKQSGVTNGNAYVVSDFGKDLFAAADKK